jgi:transketolase
MKTKRSVQELKAIAQRMRVQIVTMLNEAGSGHTGGSLSAVEIITSLYFCKMNLDPKDPHWPQRDRFVLSKGHAAPALYCALAEVGYIKEEELMTLRKVGSSLQGHPDMHVTPGVEISTGSLGQGLSAGNGMALAARLDKKPSRIYVLLGDGEVQEGQVWEAMGIEPLAAKWEAFGWHTTAVDGHDFRALLDALDEAEGVKGKPSIIIAATVKGKGVSVFQGKVEYHGVAPTDDELEEALKELHD